MGLDAAREVLRAMAVAFAGQQESAQALRQLCEAAWNYAEARRELASGTAAAKGAEVRGDDDGPVMPFGKEKGKPIKALGVKSLQWLMGVMEEKIADPEKARFIDENTALRDAARAELTRRQSGR